MKKGVEGSKQEAAAKIKAYWSGKSLGHVGDLGGRGEGCVLQVRSEAGGDTGDR